MQLPKYIYTSDHKKDITAFIYHIYSLYTHQYTLISSLLPLSGQLEPYSCWLACEGGRVLAA